MVEGVAVFAFPEDLWKALYLKIRRFVYAVAFRVLNGNEELAKDMVFGFAILVIQFLVDPFEYKRRPRPLGPPRLWLGS